MVTGGASEYAVQCVRSHDPRLARPSQQSHCPGPIISPFLWTPHPGRPLKSIELGWVQEQKLESMGADLGNLVQEQERCEWETEGSDERDADVR